ncbi:MAG TPA: TadG family pilus assembly protein, partial [Candidatus Udaeobacter sp.]|nr:TadG family pilus assembly protein [Candidatus Udaeobacter sp.]
MTVLAVLGLMVVLGAAALAVDVSMLMAARTQLSIAADAAALAGVKELPFGSRERARTRAVEYAARNEVLGTPVTLDLGQGGGGDVELGFYDFDRHAFQPEDLMPNAVRVTARRTGERAVPTFFAAVFGRRHVDVSSRAVAVGYPRTGVLVFDSSASMGDPAPGPIVPARNAAADFLGTLAQSTLAERMGLVSYASTASQLFPIRGLHNPGQLNALLAITRGI